MLRGGMRRWLLPGGAGLGKRILPILAIPAANGPLPWPVGHPGNTGQGGCQTAPTAPCFPLLSYR
ncbi:hypothetical protein LMG26411_03319 [Cupriavidus numazuensis]|uniref:Uncharacterized protein n=1 Tax=Cupriavidus numazuensis TaxID=221992 RepID=A0ABN7Q2F0_9BURK|nr:hypothetical protein LMG26411_03319 [Cupriavidus numazuensis]